MPSDSRFCFVAYHDLEQIEAGDTLTHTFKWLGWVYCNINYYYFWGTHNILEMVSTSAIFSAHYVGPPPPLTTNLTEGRMETWARASSSGIGKVWFLIGVTGVGTTGYARVANCPTGSYGLSRITWEQTENPPGTPQTSVLYEQWVTDHWDYPMLSYYSPLTGDTNKCGFLLTPQGGGNGKRIDDTRIYKPVGAGYEQLTYKDWSNIDHWTCLTRSDWLPYSRYSFSTSYYISPPSAYLITWRGSYNDVVLLSLI